MIAALSPQLFCSLSIKYCCRSSFLVPIPSTKRCRSGRKIMATSAEGSRNQLPIELDPTVLPKLDPAFVKYFNEAIGRKSPTHLVPLEQIRNDPHKWSASWQVDLAQNGCPRVRDWNVTTTDSSSIVVRVYHPDPERFGHGPYGSHLNYHGGGFMFGDLTSDALFCHRMRDRLPIVVIDVNYRLCPGTLEKLSRHALIMQTIADV